LTRPVVQVKNNGSSWERMGGWEDGRLSYIYIIYVCSHNSIYKTIPPHTLRIPFAYPSHPI
jgi:hypothetical protein